MLLFDKRDLIRMMKASWGWTVHERATSTSSTVPEGQQISEDGIRRVVDAFYAKVRADRDLAPIFERALPGDWGPHLATMRDFWSSLMLTSGRYKGNPLVVHQRLEGMTPDLFDRWLELFGQTCGELFEESVAEAFRTKAARIAESFKLALFYRIDRPLATEGT
jgi:hemoglobin